MSQRRHGLPTAEAARELQQRATQAEAVLWNELRDRRLDGLKFRRQRPLGPFVVDFVCLEAQLVVEVDGSIHDQHAEQDAYRTEFTASYSLRVLRVRNDEVLSNLPAVLDRIKHAAVAT